MLPLLSGSYIPLDFDWSGSAAMFRAAVSHDPRPTEPVCSADEHICGCTAPGCKCKVMTVLPVCTLCSSGDHTRF
ncbi:hypothetical protein CspHIS471_0407280 [Cutaneotrichosporon sp. HIS471]|nr:hypothetical protein CspHIS471_0407280 [Cutaneotrichosporon sp. HIS471]